MLINLLLISFGLLLGQSHAQYNNDCNYIQLVKCLMNVLDEWALALWDNRENVVTIDDGACVHLHAIGRCVDDTSDVTHGCSNEEVMECAQTVSDLLTHRKGQASFLWSYHLLKFSCSPRGRDILSVHRDCLNRDRIGAETLSATTYLINTLNKTADDQACDVLSEKLTNFRQSLSEVCGGESPAAEILCESLKGHSVGVFPNKVQRCDYDCTASFGDELDTYSPNAAEPGSAEARNGDPTKVPDPGAQGQQPSTSSNIQSSSSSFVAALLIVLLSILLS